MDYGPDSLIWFVIWAVGVYLKTEELDECFVFTNGIRQPISHFMIIGTILAIMSVYFCANANCAEKSERRNFSKRFTA